MNDGSTGKVTNSNVSGAGTDLGSIATRSRRAISQSSQSMARSVPFPPPVSTSNRPGSMRRAVSSYHGLNLLQIQQLRALHNQSPVSGNDSGSRTGSVHSSNFAFRRRKHHHHQNRDRAYTPPQMRVVRHISDVYHNSSSSSDIDTERSDDNYSDNDDSKHGDTPSIGNRSHSHCDRSHHTNTHSEADGASGTPDTFSTSITSPYFLPGRLIERDQTFNQSTGALKIEQHADRESWAQILALYTWDWFHVLLTQPNLTLVVFLTFVYTFWVVLFAGLYLAVNDNEHPACDLAGTQDELNFGAAFAFSLSTAATIGYGLVDDSLSFFHQCPQVPVIVFFQCLVIISINAFLVGIVYQRIGRPDSRSHQVIFSNKACIRCVAGQFYLSFQVYDLDRHNPVVEAHVRCYAVNSESDGLSKALFQTRHMRLQNPNDDLGSVLFLSIPSNVVHAIDNWSPLMPPELEREHWEFIHDNFVHSSANRYVFPGLVLRDNDPRDGSRESVSCPICGEAFETDEHLLRHIRYMKREEDLDSSEDEDKTKSEKGHIVNPRLKSLKHEHVSLSSDSIYLSENDSHSVPSKHYRERHYIQYHKHHKNEGEVRVSHHFSNTPELINYAQPEYKMGHRHVNTDILLTRDKVIPNDDYIPDMSEDSPNTAESKYTSSNIKNTMGQPRTGGISNSSRARMKTTRFVREEIRQHIFNSHLEVFVIVEGIEPNSSHTFQARHSYSFENIEFDHWFAPCVKFTKDGRAQVDLNKFHTIVPVPDHVAETEPVQSML